MRVITINNKMGGKEMKTKTLITNMKDLFYYIRESLFYYILIRFMITLIVIPFIVISIRLLFKYAIFMSYIIEKYIL